MADKSLRREKSTATSRLLLVVEDEFLLHLAIEDELNDAGYESVLVTNRDRAIEELERRAAEFGDVITDIRLGDGPSGWQAAHRARELAPTVPIVYMSGDSAKEWAANGVPKSVMLSKPFAMVTAVSQLVTAAAFDL